jgi:AraC-like DNA-binding protein
METLVGRIRRVFTSKTKDERMERLERTLSGWLKDKGWRIPVRTVGEAAERLDTDTGLLHRYFKERVGMDFRTWRTRLRLEDAKRMLLEHPERQAAETARLVGFSNRSNFARQFLAYTGYTPAQWIEKARMSHDSRTPENDYV